MKMKTLIQNAIIVNEGQEYQGSVLIEGERVSAIYHEGDAIPLSVMESLDECIDASGKYLIPGLIDTHVHFRDPGLTHKADMESESRAALAGGVTSFIDMPNTMPQTTNLQAWQDKMDYAATHAKANYAFYIGATEQNFEELAKADYTKVPAVKLFMGSSTGNMLVDANASLKKIFAEIPALIAVHCESESLIQANKAKYMAEVGEDLPVEYHSKIRDEEVCYQSSEKAVKLAREHGARLHLLHVSTQKELSLLEAGALADKKITAETCPHYLWLSDEDYAHYGSLIKCNPALKHPSDRAALLDALRMNVIDTLGSDHAPHLLSEKQGNALTAVSGCPSIQFNLPLMMEFVAQGMLEMSTLVEKFCHAPATLYRIQDRGFIREGSYADLVLVEPKQWTLTKADILSKCAWSPYESWTFSYRVSSVFLNGSKAYEGGRFYEAEAKNLIFKN